MQIEESNDYLDPKDYFDPQEEIKKARIRFAINDPTSVADGLHPKDRARLVYYLGYQGEEVTEKLPDTTSLPFPEAL